MRTIRSRLICYKSSFAQTQRYLSTDSNKIDEPFNVEEAETVHVLPSPTEKENKDTQEALGLIEKMLGVQPKSFRFSGTKDKRSVSTQRVIVFKQQASKLDALNKRLFGIKVGDFSHVKEGLLLGQLMGNRFTITLRMMFLTLFEY